MFASKSYTYFFAPFYFEDGDWEWIYANKLSKWKPDEEVKLFRAAAIHALQNAEVLFHNHLDGEKLRFGYPLIQYKRIRRKAAIVCVV